MKNGYISVQYHVGNASTDFEEFKKFVHKEITGEQDVEDLCLNCGIDKKRMNYVQRFFKLPKAVLLKRSGMIDWDAIYVEYEYFTDSIVHDLKDYIDFKKVSGISKNVTEECLEAFIDRIDFGVLSGSRILSFGFMEKYSDLLDWEAVTSMMIAYHKLTDEFISRFREYIDMHVIAQYGELSTSQLDKYRDIIDWQSMTIWRHWQEGEMEKFSGYIDWEALEKIGNYYMCPGDRQLALRLKK